MSICSRRVCSPRWWAARQVLARTLSHSKSGLASSCEARNCNARPRRSPSTAANPFLADLCVLVGRLARGLVEERPNQQRRASVPATAACARGTEFVLWNLYRRRRWAQGTRPKLNYRAQYCRLLRQRAAARGNDGKNIERHIIIQHGGRGRNRPTTRRCGCGPARLEGGRYPPSTPFNHARHSRKPSLSTTAAVSSPSSSTPQMTPSTPTRSPIFGVASD